MGEVEKIKALHVKIQNINEEMDLESISDVFQKAKLGIDFEKYENEVNIKMEDNDEKTNPKMDG